MPDSDDSDGPPVNDISSGDPEPWENPYSYLEWVMRSKSRLKILDQLKDNPVVQHELREEVANEADIAITNVRTSIDQAKRKGLIEERYDVDPDQKHYALTKPGRVVANVVLNAESSLEQHTRFMAEYPEGVAVTIPHEVLSAGTVTFHRPFESAPTKQLGDRLTGVEQVRVYVPVITNGLHEALTGVDINELVTSRESVSKHSRKTDTGGEVLAGTPLDHIHTLPIDNLPRCGLVLDSAGVALLTYARNDTPDSLLEYDVPMPEAKTTTHDGNDGDSSDTARDDSALELGAEPRQQFIADCHSFYVDLREQATPADVNN